MINKQLLDEGDWQDLFHEILPETPEINFSIDTLPRDKIRDLFCVYRATCQTDLARWMVLRELENWHKRAR